MFMFGGGKGMGGGGGMLRTVGRAVTSAGVNLQEPLSSSSSSSSSTVTSPNATSSRAKSTNNLAIASASSSFVAHNLPISANSGLGNPTWSAFGPSSPCCEDYEWVSVDGSDDDFVLGPVPSLDEVQNAVSALQQVFDPASYSQLVRDKYAYNLEKNVADQISNPTALVNRVSSVGPELDWIEPSLQLCNSRMLQPYGSGRVYDAFHLLQTEPTVQKMVISLSSDKAVWDAVLNNEVVRELRESYYAAENNTPESSDETQASDDSNAAMNFIMWIFDNTKVKVMEIIEKITNLTNELFKCPDDENTTAGATATDPFEEKLRTSFLISVVVLLVVVVTRAHRA